MKKKWLIFVLILIVVAVVLAIVFINLFTDKTTKTLTKELHNYTTSGYLNKDNDASKQTDKYLDKLIVLSELKVEKAKLENAKYSFKAYQVMAEFVNSEMVYTKYTDVYRANRKAISKSLKAASANAYNVLNYVKENNDKVEGNSQWLAKTYDDTKADIENLVLNTQNAFQLLQKVHLSCVASAYFNNDLVKLVFTHIDEIVASLKEQKENAGKEFLDFVNMYLSKENLASVISYPTNTNLQNQVKDLIEKGDKSQFYNNFLIGKLG